jgi:hypothetical protein
MGTQVPQIPLQKGWKPSQTLVRQGVHQGVLWGVEGLGEQIILGGYKHRKYHYILCPVRVLGFDTCFFDPNRTERLISLEKTFFEGNRGYQ